MARNGDGIHPSEFYRQIQALTRQLENLALSKAPAPGLNLG